jgi:hypothetical protein
MAFSERSLTFLSGLREEIVRLERDLQKLKKVREALEDYLSDERLDRATDPPFPSPEIPPDRTLSVQPARPPGNRPGSSGQAIGDMAIAILESEDRPFSLDELADKIRADLGEDVSADLKNAVRVALLRRSHRVARETRGRYRLKKDIQGAI